MKDKSIAQGSGRRTIVTIGAAIAVAWAIVLLVAGCTSDPASTVGVGLIGTTIDSTLVELDVRTIDVFAGLRVDNPAVPIPQQQSLYLGTEADTRASFLVNFDIANRDTDLYPDSLFTEANIKNVFLSLTRLNTYAAGPETVYVGCPGADCDTLVYPEANGPENTYYFVHELAEPFDEADFDTYPATVPVYSPTIIVKEFAVPVPGRLPRLPIYEDYLVDWHALGVPFGLLVRLGDPSDPGLLGLASAELTQYTEIPTDAVGTIPGPNLIIEFEGAGEGLDNLLIPPSADTTVFEEVATAPATAAEAADGFMLRTGLRSYPAFSYDLSNLPANVIINRAVLSVVNDVDAAFGPTMSIQVSEILTSVMESGPLVAETLLDSTLVYPLSYRSNLRTSLDTRIEFDVTYGMQRVVNRVNEEPRGFLLSGIEDKGTFSPSPDVTLPDFYYRQFRFLGLADPDPANRPFLKVWYSVDDVLTEGGR